MAAKKTEPDRSRSLRSSPLDPSRSGLRPSSPLDASRSHRSSPLRDDEACAAAVGRVGAIDRDLARIGADKDAAVAAAASDAEERAKPLNEEREDLVRRIRVYAERHRDRLTGGKGKTFDLPTGKCAWRIGRDTVELDEARSDKIIAAVKRLGDAFRERFIKVKETVSKTAIAGATDAEKTRLKRIAGIRFVKGEEAFSVSPVELPLAEPKPERR